MVSVFFGNSFTSGENNGDVSFVDYMPGSSYNLGVSGTTMGEYSIYPVDGNSLLSVIDRNPDTIKRADYIFIQYGANDVSAMMAGFVRERVVIVSFVKALDAIKQLNPEARIIFLTTSTDPYIINRLAARQCDYLKNDYFKGYPVDIPTSLWVNCYKTLMDVIAKKLEVVSMIDDFEFFDLYISNDNIHPNNGGHKKIAETICRKLF